VISVRAAVRDGVTWIEVTGHERGQGETGEAGKVCAGVSAITNTCLLGLHHMAGEYPDLVSFTIEQE
jgi:uncharacterized protein YsxB (DUF464 family)